MVAHNTQQCVHATHTTRAAPTHTATSGRQRTALTWQLNTDNETFPIGTREYTQRHGARLYAPSQFDMRAHQQRYNGRSSPLSVQIPATCFSVSPSSHPNTPRTHRTFGLGGLCKSSAQSVGNLDADKKIESADVTDKTNKRGPNGTTPLLLLPHQYDFTLTLTPRALLLSRVLGRSKPLAHNMRILPSARSYAQPTTFLGRARPMPRAQTAAAPGHLLAPCHTITPATERWLEKPQNP